MDTLDRAPCTDREIAKPNIPTTARTDAMGMPMLSATTQRATKFRITLTSAFTKPRTVVSSLKRSRILSMRGPMIILMIRLKMISRIRP